MDKTDTRIKKTRHIEIGAPKPNAAVPAKPTPAEGPCDSCGNPIIPEKPIPNTNRPKRKGEKQEELIFTNGLQKIDNTVSIKINPDSTNFLRTSKNGLSAKYLANKLECIAKAIKKLNRGMDQLKDEVQPVAIGEKIVEIDKEFEMNPNGTMHLKLGNGLDRNTHDYIQVKIDNDTLGFDNEGRLMTVWSCFEREENE